MDMSMSTPLLFLHIALGCHCCIKAQLASVQHRRLLRWMKCICNATRS